MIMNVAFDKKLKSMSIEELKQYLDEKKYTQHHMDYYLEVIQNKNKLIDELYDICQKQNKYIKDIIELKGLAEDINISCAKAELINKKLQQLATEIR